MDNGHFFLIPMNFKYLFSFLGLLLLNLGSSQSGGSHWSYQELDDHGPTHWPGVCHDGKQQSPIDIRDQDTIRADLGNWKLWPYHGRGGGDFVHSAEIVNNGHSLKMTPTDNKNMHIFGAGLADKYQFAQLHLHWGNESRHGSEHTLNGRAYPMEMHFVHYNTKYPDIGESLSHEDGLAVIGVMFELSSSDNPSLTPLIDAARKVTSAKEKSMMSQSINLKSLLPDNVDVFYRYQGSLTTPGCNEIVTWSVIRQSIPVSENQLKQLRLLEDSDGFNMGNNFRPVMPLNRRLVLINEPSRGGKYSVTNEVTKQDPIIGLKMLPSGENGETEKNTNMAGMVPGWAVVLISLAVAFNVGVAALLLFRRQNQRYPDHIKVPTHDT